MGQEQLHAVDESKWQKTLFANLVRYESSGIYFARLRIRGKLIRRSLKPDALSVAKLRLSDLEQAERRAAETTSALTAGKMTAGDLVALFKTQSEQDVRLKPASRKYRLELIRALLKTWPSLEKTDVRKITTQDCKAWALKVANEYSPVRQNGMIGILRNIFNMATEAGAAYQNPALQIRKAKLLTKKLSLPSARQFSRFVQVMSEAGGRDSRNCANLVQFLAFGGFRKTEATHVIWADCDFTRGTILVRGDPITGTKNWETHSLPMIPAMQKLLGALRKQRAEDSEHTTVMPVRECQKAMNRVAIIVSMHRITHHDLRHFFATNCIESGVDVPTVSRWLGHKDGGALAMKVYGHLRDQHSVDMALRACLKKHDC